MAPLLVSVPPLLTTSVALLPQPSPLVRISVPALVKLPAAVTTACSLQVLSSCKVCPAARLPLRALLPRSRSTLAPLPL